MATSFLDTLDHYFAAAILWQQKSFDPLKMSIVI
jgi:hypothetical protein